MKKQDLKQIIKEAVLENIKKRQLNELTSDTVLSTIIKMAERDQWNRAQDIIRQHFSDFLGNPNKQITILSPVSPDMRLHADNIVLNKGKYIDLPNSNKPSNEPYTGQDWVGMEQRIKSIKENKERKEMILKLIFSSPYRDGIQGDKVTLDYNIDRDEYKIPNKTHDGKKVELSRKDGVVLSQIAMHINPKTKYTLSNVTSNFKIADY